MVTNVNANLLVLKMKSKDYYWSFMDKVELERKRPQKWVRDLKLNSQEANFSIYFKQVTKICKENKLGLGILCCK